LQNINIESQITIMRPYILSETSWKIIKENEYNVAILPWGATEPHNYHLPYGTDNYETEAIAATSASMAWEAGAKVLVLPAVPFGVNTTQMSYPGTVNLHPSTQSYILNDIVESLDQQGIHKLVVLNGHGGNYFKSMIREIMVSFPDMFISTIDWFKVLDTREFFEDQGEHAGELETSLMQVIAPHLVLDLKEAGTGESKNFIFQAHQEGWAWSPRDWPRVTEDTGIGNPAKATSEKGQKYLEELCAAIAGYFYELSVVKREDEYE
jgi:creatinine amidohydrolase